MHVYKFIDSCSSQIQVNVCDLCVTVWLMNKQLWSVDWRWCNLLNILSPVTTQHLGSKDTQKQKQNLFGSTFFCFYGQGYNDCAYVSRVGVFLVLLSSHSAWRQLKTKKSSKPLGHRIIKVCGIAGAAVVVFNAKWEWTVIMSNAHITSRGQTSGTQTQTAGPAHDHRNNTV